jgi:hypothetical protein
MLWQCIPVQFEFDNAIARHPLIMGRIRGGATGVPRAGPTVAGPEFELSTGVHRQPACCAETRFQVPRPVAGTISSHSHTFQCRYRFF